MLPLSVFNFIVVELCHCLKAGRGGAGEGQLCLLCAEACCNCISEDFDVCIWANWNGPFPVSGLCSHSHCHPV